MNWLVDTNILLCLIEPESSHYPDARAAIDGLLQVGDSLYVLIQNVSEFWNVCTRPVERNGLGLTINRTNSELSNLESVFDVLSDTGEVYEIWRKMVVKLSVSGAKVHDAKIVASMKAHGIDKLLTFNTKDFKRFHEIEAVDPADIVLG